MREYNEVYLYIEIVFSFRKEWIFFICYNTEVFYKVIC